MNLSLFGLQLWHLALAQTEEVPPAAPVVHNSQLLDLTLALGGLFLVWLAGRWLQLWLQDRGFDPLFVPPWKPLFAKEDQPRWSASKFLVRCVQATGIALVLVLFLQRRGYTLIAPTPLLLILGQIWLLLATTFVALAIARFVAAAVISIFDNTTVRTQLELMCPHDLFLRSGQTQTGPADPAGSSALPRWPFSQARRTTADAPPAEPEVWSGRYAQPESPADLIVRETLQEMAEESATRVAPPAPTAPLTSASATTPLRPISGKRQVESFADTVARLVGMLVYLMIFLPVFMITAELWGWTATGNALGDIWRWLLPFVGIAATVLIGWFIVTALALTFCPPRHRRTVMIITTFLALVLLSASYNLAFAIVFSILLFLVLWFTRHDLPDLFAGFYLQMQQEPAIKTIDGPARIKSPQILTSDIVTLNGSYRVRNRYLLRCFLDGNTLEESRMIKLETTPETYP